jgi:hypothetical protein
LLSPNGENSSQKENAALTCREKLAKSSCGRSPTGDAKTRRPGQHQIHLTYKFERKNKQNSGGENFQEDLKYVGAAASPSSRRNLVFHKTRLVEEFSSAESVNTKSAVLRRRILMIMSKMEACST